MCVCVCLGSSASYLPSVFLSLLSISLHLPLFSHIPMQITQIVLWFASSCQNPSFYRLWLGVLLLFLPGSSFQSLIFSICNQQSNPVFVSVSLAIILYFIVLRSSFPCLTLHSTFVLHFTPFYAFRNCLLSLYFCLLHDLSFLSVGFCVSVVASSTVPIFLFSFSFTISQQLRPTHKNLVNLTVPP